MADTTGWRTLHHETVFASGPIHEIAVETVQLPDGRMIPDYHVIRLSDYVLVYAQMTDGSVPMLRQYKHGPRRVCLTFPGGAIEEGESPLDAARRELLEEVGCTATEWHSLGAFVTNANQGCNTAHLFRANGCQRVRQSQSGDLEEMTIVQMNASALRERQVLADIGLIAHVALLMLATHPLASAPR
jgi:ADP-ribose pyrophosphatase